MRKTPVFFDENWPKWQTIVIITSVLGILLLSETLAIHERYTFVRNSIKIQVGIFHLENKSYEEIS
jgi:hypothetical protein